MTSDVGTLGICLSETSVTCKLHLIARLYRGPLDACVMDKGRKDRAPALSGLRTDKGEIGKLISHFSYRIVIMWL